MWPFKRFNNKLVTITITPDCVGCTLISTSSSIAPLALIAHEYVPLSSQNLSELTLFNPTSLARAINAFIDRNKVRHSFASIALSGSSIKEEIIFSAHAHSPLEGNESTHAAHRVTQARYLYPSDNNKHAWYVCSIERPTLLQFELLAHMAQLNLIRITTLHLAILQLYRSLYGAAFRPAQLGMHLARHHHNIDNLLPIETLHRVLHIPIEQSGAKHHHHHLLGACGLFVSENGYGFHR